MSGQYMVLKGRHQILLSGKQRDTETGRPTCMKSRSTADKVRQRCWNLAGMKGLMNVRNNKMNNIPEN
jgi:hypothetical protein